MRIAILTAAALLVTGPAALADPGTPARAKPAKGSPEEVVCRRDVNTGSWVQGRRTCMTRAQWTAQAEASQRDAQRAVDQGSVRSCGATTPGTC